MKKNHDRSADKRGFSIALPITLIDQLEKIAREEHRSRNGQIEYFLDKSVKAWNAQAASGSNQSVELRTTKKSTIHEASHHDEALHDHIESEAPFQETSKSGIIKATEGQNKAKKRKTG